jgi:hypothetical protein
VTNPSSVKTHLAGLGIDAHVRVVSGTAQVEAFDRARQAEAQAAAEAFVAAERVRPLTAAERLRAVGMDPVRAALVLAARGTPEEATAAEAILVDELARVRRALGRGSEEVTRG